MQRGRTDRIYPWSWYSSRASRMMGVRMHDIERVDDDSLRLGAERHPPNVRTRLQDLDKLLSKVWISIGEC